ncbi:RrF2 family transcriptional regulator [Flagellimonas pacifica]|uniref:Transcriptional regulator, BadM/Rrf2 family n=1 Tax=Flagellimonas pacifica TaxID=1247520 RepID=A0A285MZQ2_9FLAO|nr:Rrf2 family transcriptional regulator [Allomuricauda parva]SNZ02037.1 transcriptional regulator, BadM/Rrf2 family [Allomuricauda parva]
MLTNSAKYAMKAVLFLALNTNENNKMMVKDIYERINVPQSYLAKLLQELSKHNIVSSSRGPKGGFYLDDKNKSIRLIKIVDIIDGEQRLRSCMLSLKECDNENPCALHRLVGDANSSFIKNLEETTIESLIADVRDGKSILPL